jgi:hypothetical protein
MTTSLNLSTGTWASIDEECPLNCTVEGSDLATIVIGDEDQSVELIFNAAGLRRLVDAGTRAATDMDALFEQENAARDGTADGTIQDGAGS